LQSELLVWLERERNADDGRGSEYIEKAEEIPDGLVASQALPLHLCSAHSRDGVAIAGLEETVTSRTRVRPLSSLPKARGQPRAWRAGAKNPTKATTGTRHTHPTRQWNRCKPPPVTCQTSPRHLRDPKVRHGAFLPEPLCHHLLSVIYPTLGDASEQN